MITEYHRPRTIEEALKLLKRPGISTRPLAGGTVVNRPSQEAFEVVDLQALGLSTIEVAGQSLKVGATATLQSLLEVADIPPALDVALRQETTFNLRQVASLAGTLIAADGRSTLATLLLAMDAQLALEPEAETVSLGNFLPLRHELLPGKLVTQVSLPLKAKAAFEYVARSPADLPVVCAAICQWPSGRTRLALGGWGDAPVLAMDGPESGGLEAAARNAASDAGDTWASADYRQEMAVVLAKRCLKTIEGE